MKNRPPLLSSWDCFHLEIILNLWLLYLLSLSEHCLDFTLPRKGAVKLQCTKITTVVWKIRISSVIAIELDGEQSRTPHKCRMKSSLFFPTPTPHSQGKAFRIRQLWSCFCRAAQYQISDWTRHRWKELLLRCLSSNLTWSHKTRGNSVKSWVGLFA